MKLTPPYKILFPYYAHSKSDMEEIRELIKTMLIGPLGETNVADYEVLWYGPWLTEKWEDMNVLLVEKCLEYSPNTVLFWNGWQPDYSPIGECFVRLSTIHLIKKLFDVKVGFFWSDVGCKGVPLIDDVTGICDFSLTHEHPSQFRGTSRVPDKYYTVSTVYSPSLFHADPYIEREHDVLFIGGIAKYKDRRDGIKMIQQAGIDILLPGGRGHHPITSEKYSDFTKNSKIIVNWTKFIHGGFHQAKGRIFEATLAGSLLVSEECDAVNYFFKPNIDYVPFSSNEELVEKLKYYLKNDGERLKIAKHGHESALSKYSAQQHFAGIIDIVENSSANESDAIKSLMSNSFKNELHNAKYLKRHFVDKIHGSEILFDDVISVLEKSNSSIVGWVIRNINIYKNKYRKRNFLKIFIYWIVPGSIRKMVKSLFQIK